MGGGVGGGVAARLSSPSRFSNDGCSPSCRIRQIFSCAERVKKRKPGVDYEVKGSLNDVEVDFAKK